MTDKMARIGFQQARHARGVAWIIAGVLLLSTVQVLVGLTELVSSVLRFTFVGASLVIVPGALLVGLGWVRRGRRFLYRDGRRLLARGKRYVLFLRPFRQDRAMEANVDRLQHDMSAALLSAQEWLLLELGRYWPTIAVGTPGELPTLGAARLWLTSDDWQAQVRDLAESAAAVVLHVGGARGIEDELRILKRLDQPLKVALVFGFAVDHRSPLHQSSYESFRRRLAPDVSGLLPETIGTATIATFDADWTPKLTECRLSPGSWWRHYFWFVWNPIRRGVRPLFRRLGRWRRPSLGVPIIKALLPIFAAQAIALPTSYRIGQVLARQQAPYGYPLIEPIPLESPLSLAFIGVFVVLAYVFGTQLATRARPRPNWL
ncbi:MAG: hypothetical protein IPM29_07380 [Planctomycetes bacterium]|nr:hypothetical protein [Planctomycetota bacterium]